MQPSASSRAAEAVRVTRRRNGARQAPVGLGKLALASSLLVYVLISTIACSSHEPTTITDSSTTINHREDPSTTTSSTETSTVTTTEDTSLTAASDQEEQDGAGSRYDDYVASDCEALSAGSSAAGEKLPSLARLVKLQGCIRSKMKLRVESLRRSGIDLMGQLSLSGGCSASIMNLLANLAEAKAFAFKFVDASFKVQSGLMHGVLADFGHFDECMSIRSNPRVELEQEQEEGTYSGKYCLSTVRLNYHVELAPNASVPEGIASDGVLWDELMRQYWLSNSPKASQAGFCVPSRCNADDLDQLYQIAADKLNFVGRITSCQSQLDLKRQHQPDLVQRIILYVMYLVLALCLFATLIDSYTPTRALQTRQHLLLEAAAAKSHDLKMHQGYATASVAATTNFERVAGGQLKQHGEIGSLSMRLVRCFSLTRNWREFIAPEKPKNRQVVVEWPLVGLNHNGSAHDRRVSASSTSSEMSELEDESSASSSRSRAKRPSSAALVDMSRASGLRSRRDTLSISIDSGHLDCSLSSSSHSISLSHLVGLRLLVLLWVTFGHSFLYPSGTNYQHYRSLVNMNITRDTLWFAATNYTLGIDMLLYISGFLLVVKFYTSAFDESHQQSAKSTTMWLLRHAGQRLARFWPVYVALMALAIVLPLASDGPMWPELVNERLGANCRSNWWLNMLAVNNYQAETQVCLPSSWFVSVVIQTLLFGSLVLVVSQHYSLHHALVVIAILLSSSAGFSFAIAYYWRVPAPVIRIDESSVLPMDAHIYSLYTDTLNSLGPFLVGMLGGYAILFAASTSASSSSSPAKATLGWPMWPFALAATIAVVMSTFHQNYSRVWSALYWSSHRIVWAFATGYLMHQCATGKWRLVGRLLSPPKGLEALARLQYIAYLVFPLLIHVHTGQIRDGLSLSLYNTINVFISRLVVTYAVALALHITVELPARRLIDTLVAKRRTKEEQTTAAATPTSTSSTAEHEDDHDEDSCKLDKTSQSTAPGSPSDQLLSAVVVDAAPSSSTTSTDDDDEYMEAVEHSGSSPSGESKGSQT